jgi:hypothetical protein
MPCIRALGGVALDETFVGKTVEPVVPALGVQTQQMFAQQRHLLPIQSPDNARQADRDGIVAHNPVSFVGSALPGGVFPRPWILCVAPCFQEANLS